MLACATQRPASPRHPSALRAEDPPNGLFVLMGFFDAMESGSNTRQRGSQSKAIGEYVPKGQRSFQPQAPPEVWRHP
jgi:hypothetical protein